MKFPFDLSEVESPEFTGPEEGWPPHPKNVTDFRHIPWKWAPDDLTEEKRVEIRGAALQDNRVTSALGERFAYITTFKYEHSKKLKEENDSDLQSPVPFTTLVSFFSHSNNSSIEVYMKDLHVENIINRGEGYNLPEGNDEIRIAIDLARKDSRLMDKVSDLTANAILSAPEKDSDRSHDRVLLVTFSKKEREGRPIYHATVNLTSNKVISAGPLRRSSQVERI